MSGFNFGSAGGSGSSNLFGSNNAQTGSSGLFGSTTTPSTSSPFGQTSTATSQPASTGLFGPGNTPAPTFGSGGASSGTTAPSLFGTSTGNAPAGGLFGNKPTSSSAPSGQNLFGSAASPASFGSNSGGFSFGPKKDDGNASSNENKAPATGGGLFGGLNNSSAPSISIPAGTTTPAKPSFSFGNSTTPAGPPPANDAQKSGNNLFGGAGGAAGSSNLFGGAKNTAPAQAPSPLFSSTSTPAGAGGLFGTAPSKPAGSGMFNNLNSSTPTTSGPTTTSAATTEAPKAFSFPSSTPASTPSSQQPSSTPAPTNLFSAPKPNAGSSTPASSMSNLFSGAKPGPTTSAPAVSSGLFGNNSATTTSASTEPAKTTTSSLFGGLAASKPATTASTPSTAAPATTAPASLFGASTTPAATQSSATSTTAATGITSTTGTNPTQTAPNFGNSTVGPAPQSARLKNKTMDEIITRWASDLSKYQKEFQTQAAKVAAWDRLMVDNGDKIQKLYVETHEAERHHAEIERQLTNVEGQQDELASWLDRYEADVDEMFQRQVGQGDSLQGPDQERERTYKLAERLTDKLDGMGKELTTMIEAINDASTTLSKTSKSDDPLSHIVRVLNSHLTQLQWIDENATALQSKLAGAEKMGASIGPNGYGGPESDAADSFYRSLLGRK